MLQLPDKLKRRRRLRAAVGAIAALAAVAACAPGANAATYTVSACNAASGLNHSWSSYSNSAGSNLALGVSCPGSYAPGNPAITYNSGIFARNVSNISYSPNGVASGFILYAPPGNSLASMSGDWWSTRAAGSGFYSAMFTDWGIVSGCGWDSSDCVVYPGPKSVSLGGSSQVHIEVGCKNPAPGCDANNTNRTIFELYSAAVTVNDLSSPSNSVSGSLWTGAWQRGTNSVTVAASDAGDGIQQNRLEIDDQLVAQQNARLRLHLHAALLRPERQLQLLDDAAQRRSAHRQGGLLRRRAGLPADRHQDNHDQRRQPRPGAREQRQRRGRRELAHLQLVPRLVDEPVAGKRRPDRRGALLALPRVEPDELPSHRRARRGGWHQLAQRYHRARARRLPATRLGRGRGRQRQSGHRLRPRSPDVRRPGPRRRPARARERLDQRAGRQELRRADRPDARGQGHSPGLRHPGLLGHARRLEAGQQRRGTR